MSTEIKTPELPESVDEATLLTWHADTGARVDRDAKIADVETDKIVLEVYAPADGVLEHKVEEGGVLKRDEVIAVLREEASKGDISESEAPGDDQEAKRSASDADKKTSRGSSGTGEDEAHDAGAAEEEKISPKAGDMRGQSPAVRRLLVEHQLQSSQIEGSGKDGRITRQDVMRFIEETPEAKKNLGLGRPERVPDPSKAKRGGASQTPEDDPTVRRVPMSQLRQRVAARLKEVQDTAALLTTFNEVNMKPVVDIRSKYKDRFEKDYGVKLGFMSFFVKAAVESLKKYPVVNASIEGKDIVYHESCHIGIAVDSPRGLVVPVLRNAESMSFAAVENTIRELAAKARDAKLAYEDLIGGTFTITNGGVFGSMLSTPIVNAPQSAILGMHTIQDRAWVEDGEVVVRPVMYLALTYDHRIIDGRDAVGFLGHIKSALEDPAQLMLQL